MMLFSKFKKHAKDESGAAMILFALLITILLGFTALAFDYGRVYYSQSQLQSAVDIAARAGSRQQVNLTNVTNMTQAQKDASVKQVIKYYLKENGFPEEKLKVCDIGIDPTTGISIDAKSKVDLNFARIFTDEPIPIKAGTNAITEVTVIEGKKLTVDVVFVLDISGSMYNSRSKYETKFIPMINAVNTAIKSILDYNPNNRVSVVVYSSDTSTKVIMEPTSNPCTVSYVWQDSAFDRYNNRRVKFNFQCGTDTAPVYIGYKVNFSGNNSELVVAGQNGYTYQTQGGTFTQKGIYVGSQVLMNPSIEDNIERVPSVFIMTDGEATYAHSDYDGVITGYDTGAGYVQRDYGFTEKIGYYTVLTANYWKKQLSDEYSRRNGKDTMAKFYSLGYNLDDTDYRDYAAGVLSPATLLDGPMGSEGYALLDYLNNGSHPYKDNFCYADQYYEATGEAELKRVLEDFANEVVKPITLYNTKLTR